MIAVYQTAMLFSGLAREDYDNRSKSYHAVKRALENKLIGNRKQIRALLIDRVLLQHESRVLERSHVPFTKVHALVSKHLILHCYSLLISYFLTLGV